MRDKFVRLKVAADVWLVACELCRQVLDLGDTVESLHDAEDTHDCDTTQDAAAADDPPPHASD